MWTMPNTGVAGFVHIELAILRLWMLSIPAIRKGQGLDGLLFLNTLNKTKSNQIKLLNSFVNFAIQCVVDEVHFAA
jgi:hypothetical protein